MKKLTLDEAEELAMNTDYATFATEPEGNEINKADAGAFFLEGYNYALQLLNEVKRKDSDEKNCNNAYSMGYRNGWNDCRKEKDSCA